MIWFLPFRRRRLLREPIPEHWQPWIRRYRPDLQQLTPAFGREVLRRAYVIYHEKHWEGCGDFQLAEEHRVAISLQIGRMAACFEREFFGEVKSVLVYPDAYMAPDQRPIGGGVVLHQQSSRSGEAWYRGPVVIAWSELERTAAAPWRPRNVVIHEFAHHLDMRNGRDADGVPVIKSLSQAERWVRVMTESRERLVELCQAGVPDVIDCYGATEPSEFFAVASEVYFQTPAELFESWPELFRVLDEFYQAYRPNDFRP